MEGNRLRSTSAVEVEAICRDHLTLASDELVEWNAPNQRRPAERISGCSVVREKSDVDKLQEARLEEFNPTQERVT